MNCIYCGKPAGWFHRSHAECNAQHEIGRQKIIEHLKWYLQSDMSADLLGKGTLEMADCHFVSSAELHSLVIGAFKNAVDTVLEDQLLSQEEEAKLVLLQKEFALTQAELGGFIERVAKAAILRDVGAGIINLRLKVEGLSINLLKGEVVLWLFNNVELYEIKSHTSYVGGSHGVSIRIARGLYYRVGAFKGERVQTQDLVRQDRGSLIITDRSVYFSGPIKSMRIG